MTPGKRSAACADCGRPVTARAHRCQSCASRIKGKRGKVWTKAQIIAAIHGWCQKHDDFPKVHEWRVATSEHPSYETVRRTFGTWNAAVEAAGLPSRPRGRPPWGAPGTAVA